VKCRISTSLLLVCAIEYWISFVERGLGLIMKLEPSERKLLMDGVMCKFVRL
jgi:hypothetical protein